MELEVTAEQGRVERAHLWTANIFHLGTAEIGTRKICGLCFLRTMEYNCDGDND